MFWKLLRQRGVDLGGCPPWSPPLGRSAEEPPPRHGSSCPSLLALRGGLQRAPPGRSLGQLPVGILSSDGGWCCQVTGAEPGPFLLSPWLSCLVLHYPGKNRGGRAEDRGCRCEHGGGLPGPVPESRAGCPFCSQRTGWPRGGQLRLVMSPMRAVQEPDLGGGPRPFVKQSSPPAGTAGCMVWGSDKRDERRGAGGREDVGWAHHTSTESGS